MVKKVTRNSAHSVRTDDATWNRARKRATAEGVTVNFVMNELLEGYGRGLLTLPKVTKQYTNTPNPPEA